jgi:hypothetical protein
MCARHQEFKNSSSSIKGKTNVQQEDEVASAHLDKKGVSNKMLISL